MLFLDFVLYLKHWHRMKFKVVIGWALLTFGLIYGIYKSGPFLDQFADNAPAAFLFILIALIILGAIVRILRY